MEAVSARMTLPPSRHIAAPGGPEHLPLLGVEPALRAHHQGDGRRRPGRPGGGGLGAVVDDHPERGPGPRRRGERLGQGERAHHLRDDRASALPRALDGLPRPGVGLLVREPVGLHRAHREHRLYREHPELGGLLRDPEHPLPLRDGVEERDRHWRLGVGLHGLVGERRRDVTFAEAQRGAIEAPDRVAHGEGLLHVDAAVADAGDVAGVEGHLVVEAHDHVDGDRVAQPRGGLVVLGVHRGGGGQYPRAGLRVNAAR
jgi:hypothetical protein